MKNIKLIVFFLFIINTINAQNWTLQNSGTLNHLLSVYFIDKFTGYASGTLGTIVKTTDGGNQWTLLNSGNQCDLNSIFFATIDTGFAVASCGWSGAIQNTVTSGTYWEGISYPLQLYSVYFTGASIGFVCGMDGTIIKTINGGMNWITLSSNTSNNLFSIHFPVANVGMLLVWKEQY